MNNCNICDDDGLNCNTCGYDPDRASSATTGCSIQERQARVMTRGAYCDVIRDDLRWLRQMPDCLEKDHIEHVLMHSVHIYYPKN